MRVNNETTPPAADSLLQLAKFKPLPASSGGHSQEFPMVRWIAFDDETAEAVVSRLRRGAAEIQHNTPVDAALHAAGPSVIVLPSSNPGKLLIARFTKCKTSEPATSLKPSATLIASPVPPKKKAAAVKKPWWRKFVA